MTGTPGFRFEVTSYDGRAVTGHAFDPGNEDRRFVVAALVDGLTIMTSIANLYCQQLAEQTAGDASYGFHMAMPFSLLASARSLELRVANRDDLPGRMVDLDARVAPSPPVNMAGGVDWAGGLRLTGWLRECDGVAPYVRVYLDDEEIAGARAMGWRVVGAPEARPHRAFDLHLPRRFADGQAWRVNVQDDAGRELQGSPLNFFAFDEGLQPLLARLSATPGQRAQGALLDRLLPPSLPFADYAGERARFRPDTRPENGPAWGVAVVEGDGLTAALGLLEQQTHPRWTGVVLSAAPREYGFSCADLAAFLASTELQAEWILFLAPGVCPEKDALARFAAAAASHPEAPLIYCDLELIDADGTAWPLAFPAFDYERMLEQGFFASAFALPRAVAQQAARAGIDNLFRLANFPFDNNFEDREPLHLPGPAGVTPPRNADAAKSLAQATAAHLAARATPATVTARPATPYPTCHVRRRHAPSVAIVLPARGRSTPLPEDHAALRTGTADARVFVIDSGLAATTPAGAERIAAPGPFSLPRLFNVAARRAESEFVCFLDDDVAAFDEQWLVEVLSRFADPKVGIVGAKLLWPGGYVREAGVALGVGFRPVAAFRDCGDADSGYGGQLLVAHQTGAVSAIGMTVRRDFFLASGGFDTLRFPAHFYDVDLCLKVAAAGFRVLVTPHARLERSSSTATAWASDAAPPLQLERELRALRNRWGEALIEDPSYSPLLALSDPPYTALAAPPRALAPRRRRPPTPRDLPVGF